LKRELAGEAFYKDCLLSFSELDKDGNGVLDPAELFPVICHLSEAHPFHVTLGQCCTFAAFFDKDRNGVISKVEFPKLARFITLMAYLQFSKDHEDMMVQEILMGRDQIQSMIEALRWGVDQIKDVVPYMPEELLAELGSPAFEAQCAKDFTDLDKDGSGVLEPKELIPVILHLSAAHHYALTEEHCQRFVDIFDTERNGVITKTEFTSLTRFMMVMAFMETSADHNEVQDEALAQSKRDRMVNARVEESQQAVEELLRMLRADRQAVHKVVPMLPKDVYEALTSDRFVLDCHEQFQRLDQEKKGTLKPEDLFPIIMEMSEAQPCSVSAEQCARFTDIFDLDGNGVLQKDEFLDLTRFLCIMSYLHTPEGQEAAADALPVMGGSKKVEELIATMARNRENVKKVIPYLPPWLRQELLSEHFTVECLSFFGDLDKDGNGSLDPKELYPMVLTLANVHRMALDIAQCRRFTAIFDDAGTGVISKSEFVDFSRFLLIMSYLDSQEGQTIISLASQEETARLPPGQGGGDAEALQAQNTHLAVDRDFYREKVGRLTTENDDLRQKLAALDSSMRSMQAKVEEQEVRLRHAEVEMSTSGRIR